MSAATAAMPDTTTTSPVVVVTGWREPDRSRWIATLSSAYHDPTATERPVVSVQAPPGHPKTGEVLRDLLFALGKSPHVTGGSKHDDGLYDIPAAWLFARRTQELIVNDAAQLPGTVVRSLVELAAGVGCRLWLIGHHNRAGALDPVVEDAAADEWDLADFDRAWGRPDSIPERAVIAPPQLRTNDLPTSSALTFRADCRRLLPAERFDQVDTLYRNEHTTATNVFSGAGDELDHDVIAAHLRQRLRQAAATDAVVTTVRAIEAAALPRGFYIDVDLPALLNSAERNPRPGRYDAGDVAAIDAYARPVYAAVTVLAMCEVPPTEMEALTVGDAATDGSSVMCDGQHVAVPQPLRPYLQAQVLARRFAGAEDHEPLLLTDRDKPVTVTWASRRVKLAEVECSVRLARPRYDRKRLTVYSWLTAHGLAVRAIHGQSTRRQRQ